LKPGSFVGFGIERHEQDTVEKTERVFDIQMAMGEEEDVAC
jgi:hypothetical protein